MSIKINCKSYGYDCDFEAESDDTAKLIEVFEEHTILKHGVKFSQESLMQFILGSNIFCPYCNSKFDSKKDLSVHIDRIHHGLGLLEGNIRNF